MGCSASSGLTGNQPLGDHRKRAGYSDELDSTVTERWTGALVVTGVPGAPTAGSAQTITAGSAPALEPPLPPAAPESAFGADLRATLNLAERPRAPTQSSSDHGGSSHGGSVKLIGSTSGGGSVKLLSAVNASRERASTPVPLAGDVGDLNKMRVSKSNRVFIVGDHRVKVATAKFIKRLDKDIDVIVGCRDPASPENVDLVSNGIKVLSVALGSTNLFTSIKRLQQIDCAFIVSPSTNSKVQDTCQAVSALKRAGVSHIVVLSNTVVECEAATFFGDQCRSIEAYVQRSGLSYTLVRVPIYMDNYCSQIDSICNNGVFYRPLDAAAAPNIICIADLAESVGKIMLRPLAFSDKTISLNGPTTSCDMAAKAFSKALGKPVAYDRVSRSSYRTMMLNSLIPEWQAEALLQIFETHEDSCRGGGGDDAATAYCCRSTAELEAILGRPAVDIFQFANLVIKKMQAGKMIPEASSASLSGSQGASTHSADSGGGGGGGGEGGGGTSDAPSHLGAPNSSSSNTALAMFDSGGGRRQRNIRPSVDISLHRGMGSTAPQGLTGILVVSIGFKQHTPSFPSSSSLASASGGSGTLLRFGGSTSQPSSSTDLTAIRAASSSSFDSSSGVLPTRTIKINTPSGIVGTVVLPDVTQGVAAGLRSRADSRTDTESASSSVHGDGTSMQLKISYFGSKRIFLMDGHLTYAATGSAATTTEDIEHGQGNKTFPLSGYVLEHDDRDPTRFRLVSSKGEDWVYVLEARSAEDADLWVERIQGTFVALDLAIAAHHRSLTHPPHPFPPLRARRLL